MVVVFHSSGHRSVERAVSKIDVVVAAHEILHRLLTAR
jgi:hypothetical protein